MKEKELDEQLKAQEQSDKRSAYGIIFDALEREPAFTQSHTLADGVLHKLQKSRDKSRRNYWMWMAMITAAFVIAGFGSILIFMGWESFSEMKDLSIYGALIGLMVVLIQYFDDKLLRRDVKFG